jgi:tripartite-type tricarboxylate transporter receptor subunit TctC
VEGAMVSGAGGLLESGQIRILAVAEEQRLEGLQDIPTFKESGYPITISVVFSLWFPKGTPQEIVDKFCEAQERAVNRYSKEIKAGLRKVEIWGEFLSPGETMKRFKKDHEVFSKIAEELGILSK